MRALRVPDVAGPRHALRPRDPLPWKRSDVVEEARVTPAELDELRYLAQRDEQQRMARWPTPGCTGKRVFDTFGQANKVARRHARESGRRAAYHCRYCGKYHVGTATLRASKQIYRQLKQEAA